MATTTYDLSGCACCSAVDTTDCTTCGAITLKISGSGFAVPCTNYNGGPATLGSGSRTTYSAADACDLIYDGRFYCGLSVGSHFTGGAGGVNDILSLYILEGSVIGTIDVLLFAATLNGADFQIYHKTVPSADVCAAKQYIHDNSLIFSDADKICSFVTTCNWASVQYTVSS